MALSQAYPSCFYQQFSDENGKPFANGSIKTFLASDHSMPVQTWTYPGSGVKNPTVIPLDAAGRCTMALETGLAYYIELYDSQGANQGTWDNVTSSSDDGTVDPSSVLTFTSSDGSITITRNDDNVDLKVTGAEAHYGTIAASGLTNDGKIDFDTIVEGNITLAQESLEVHSDKLYHVTLKLIFTTETLGPDLETCVVTDSEGGTNEFVIDESILSNIAELSWDITPRSDLLTLSLSIPQNIALSSAVCYIHRVGTTVNDGSGSLPPSTSEDAGKVLTVDAEGDPSWENPVPQVQADWTEADSTAPDYIKNKPEIANVPAVNSGDDGKVLMASYSGGIASYSWQVAPTGVPDSTASDSGKILTVLPDGTPSWEEPAAQPQVQSDWTEADTTDPAYIQNKPESVEIQAGQNIEINEVNGRLRVDCTAQVLPASTQADEGKVLGVDSYGDPAWQPQETFTQVQADWNEADTTDPAYIKNKPDLSVYALAASVPVIGTVEL